MEIVVHNVKCSLRAFIKYEKLAWDELIVDFIE